MDNPSGMQRRSGWTWKVWVGIVVGLAVVAGLVVLIANAGGGSGGILLTKRSADSCRPLGLEPPRPMPHGGVNPYPRRRSTPACRPS
jgi:hypothetical protein